MKVFTVSKCCCCFDLRYGFYAFGVYALTQRIAILWMAVNFNYIEHPQLRTTLQHLMPVLGYFIAHTIFLCIAIIGIIQEKSVLIYPYIVYLILELILVMIFQVTVAIVVSPLYILVGLFGAALTIYVIICLISLYKQIKRVEENTAQSKAIEMVA